MSERGIYYLDCGYGFIGIYVYIQTSQIVYIKCVQIFIYQLYITKDTLKQFFKRLCTHKFENDSHFSDLWKNSICP